MSHLANCERRGETASRGESHHKYFQVPQIVLLRRTNLMVPSQLATEMEHYTSQEDPQCKNSPKCPKHFVGGHTLNYEGCYTQRVIARWAKCFPERATP